MLLGVFEKHRIYTDSKPYVRLNKTFKRACKQIINHKNNGMGMKPILESYRLNVLVSGVFQDFAMANSPQSIIQVYLLAQPGLMRNSLQAYINSLRGAHVIVPEIADISAIRSLQPSGNAVFIVDMGFMNVLDHQISREMFSLLENSAKWVALVDSLAQRAEAITHGAKSMFFKGMIDESLQKVILPSVIVPQKDGDFCIQ